MTKHRKPRWRRAHLTIGAALISREACAPRGAMDFRGCSVVITGGSRGLGLLIARELGRQGAASRSPRATRRSSQRAREDLDERGIDVDDRRLRRRQSRTRPNSSIDDVVERTGRIDVLDQQRRHHQGRAARAHAARRLRGGDGGALLGTAADDDSRRSRRCAVSASAASSTSRRSAGRSACRT